MHVRLILGSHFIFIVAGVLSIILEPSPIANFRRYTSNVVTCSVDEMWNSVIFNIKQREQFQNVAFFIDTEGTCKNYASNSELYQADCDYNSRKFYLTFNNVTEDVDGVSLSCEATYKMPSETDRANTEIDVQCKFIFYCINL